MIPPTGARTACRIRNGLAGEVMIYEHQQVRNPAGGSK